MDQAVNGFHRDLDLYSTICRLISSQEQHNNAHPRTDISWLGGLVPFKKEVSYDPVAELETYRQLLAVMTAAVLHSIIAECHCPFPCSSPNPHPLKYRKASTPCLNVHFAASPSKPTIEPVPRNTSESTYMNPVMSMIETV